jgi:hypothetical protein
MTLRLCSDYGCNEPNRWLPQITLLQLSKYASILSSNYRAVMKVISLICQKGGTAKTTTAINLAVEAISRGLEVAYIDLDAQVSACDWKDIRGDNGLLKRMLALLARGYCAIWAIAIVWSGRICG